MDNNELISGVQQQKETQMQGETKTCKYCGSVIPKKAKICPQCRKKQGGKKVLGIVVVAFIIMICVAMNSGSDGSTGTSDSNSSNSASSEEKAVKKEYISCTADELLNGLEKNALAASDDYKEKYLAIKGKLDNIDSSGSYIDLTYTSEDAFSLIGIQCYIQDDEQLDQIKKLEIGDTIVVKGKCTDVGEILGYSVDIDSVSKK